MGKKGKEYVKMPWDWRTKILYWNHLNNKIDIGLENRG
jgi:hypothetical protein